MRTPVPTHGLALSALLLTGCATNTTDVAALEAGAPTAGASAASSATPAATSATPEGAGAGNAQDVEEGTIVRFSGGGASVDVTLGPDTPTTRDFLSVLPFTTRLEEYAGREKIGDPPRALDVDGTPGSNPQDGDLIYFTPWGNLGFYYDTSGIGYSDATPHLGTYEASEEQLSQLEGQQVTVEIVQ